MNSAADTAAPIALSSMLGAVSIHNAVVPSAELDTDTTTTLRKLFAK